MTTAGDRPGLQAVLKETRSTCCYCGVGCGVIVGSTVEPDGVEQIVTVRGDPDHPANFGKLCTKGSTLHLSADPLRYAQTRAAQPEMRLTRDAPRTPVSWDTALDTVAQRLGAIVDEHGPDAVGIYISGQLLTEDYYVFNKLTRALIGTNNIDSNSRLCMSSAVSGYKTTLGADAPPCSYEDLDHASVVFIVGANPAYAHPVLYRRLDEARARNPALKVIVADPRRTDSASDATLYLPLLPGTDVALFHGMLHVMLDEGLIAQDYIDAHTEGFDALREAVRELTPSLAGQICGLPPGDIVRAARWFAAGPTLSLYCQGLNQSSRGTAKNAALINLHLASAQIGRAGAGPFSLTGQPNAMGGREVGGMASLASGHRDPNNADDRAEIARLWQVPGIPSRPGKTAVEMFDALGDGTIKAVWIVCTNPAQSLPNQPAVRAALERAEFVVLQEAYAHTATAPYADVLLPATTWGEKEGTVTNSERRISRVRAALPPYRESRHDWQIAASIGQRLEARWRFGLPTLFPYTAAEAIWEEHRATTLGRDLDIGGLSWALLEARGPQQWPFPVGASSGRTRLYEDGVFPTPTTRARFANVCYRDVAEPVDARYAFALTTGRLRDQWHGMSRTGTVPTLFAHAPEPVLEINSTDAQRLNLREGSLVKVTSRRGSMVLPVNCSEAIGVNQAFMPMHWGEEYISGDLGGHAAQDASSLARRMRGGERQSGAAHGVNSLTSPAIDPQSKQPELKYAAVRIEPAALDWRWMVLAYLPASSVLITQRELQRYLRRLPYASCVPFGRHDDPRGCGLVWNAAAREAPAAELLAEIEALFGLTETAPDVIAYRDARRGTGRRLRIVDGALRAVSLAGDISAASWLRDYLERGEPVAAISRLLLLPGATPPVASAPRSKTVCQCLGVSENAIGSWLAARSSDASSDTSSDTCGAAAQLAGLQDALKCGTQCGSCLPELRRMIAHAAALPTS
jgi:assimilatory nitrate reductase catalytic subunit